MDTPGHTRGCVLLFCMTYENRMGLKYQLMELDTLYLKLASVLLRH